MRLLFWFPIKGTNLQTVISDRIAWAFNRSGATRTVVVHISRAFDRVSHAFHRLKSYGIWGQLFGLISFFLGYRRLRVVLDGKSLQEHPVNVGFAQGSILDPTLFQLYIKTFLTMLSVILSSMVLLLLSIWSVIRHLICGNNYNMNLTCETL